MYDSKFSRHAIRKYLGRCWPSTIIIVVIITNTDTHIQQHTTQAALNQIALTAAVGEWGIAAPSTTAERSMAQTRRTRDRFIIRSVRIIRDPVN